MVLVFAVRNTQDFQTSVIFNRIDIVTRPLSTEDIGGLYFDHVPPIWQPSELILFYHQ